MSLFLGPRMADGAFPTPVADVVHDRPPPVPFDANDIIALVLFRDTHLAGSSATPAGNGRQDRVADFANELVTEALDIVGNDMPEDIRCALNVIMAAASILDTSPKPGADLKRYMADLKAIEVMLRRGVDSLAETAANGAEAAGLCHKLAGVLQDLTAEVADMHRYRANQLPLPCRLDAGARIDRPEGFVDGLLRSGVALLKQTPSNADDAARLKQQLERLSSTLPATPEDVPVGFSALDDEGFDVALRERDAAFARHRPALGALQRNIETRIAILERNIALNPLSRKAAFEAKTYSTQAAIGVIDRILSEPGRSLAAWQKNALAAAGAALCDRVTAMASQTDVKTLTKHEIEAIMGGKGKYTYRSTTEMEKEAPAITASIDALVASFVDRAGNGADTSTLPGEASDDEEGALLPPPATADARIDAAFAPSGLPLSSPAVREEHIMTTLLDKLFKRLDINPGRKLERLYRKTKIDVRDVRDWTNISRQVQLVRGDGIRNLTSELIPQAGLRRTSGNRAPVFPALVDARTGAQAGVNCHQSVNYRHPPNLAQTRLLDESGKELFNATRHGTLSAYDISPNALGAMDDAELAEVVGHLFPNLDAFEKAFPPEADPEAARVPPMELALLAGEGRPLFDGDLDTVMNRIRTDGNVRRACADKLKQAAAVARAREVALAALACQPDKLRAAEAGKPVSISINTISLLTPDTARYLLGQLRTAVWDRGGPAGRDDERSMVRDEYQAWEHIRQHGITVEGPDGPVRVAVAVNDFNFGVNDIEFLFGASSREEVQRRNARAMQAVIGDLASDPEAPIGGQVGEWMRNPFADPRRRNAVETLARQVADLWLSNAHRRAGVEPYKLVTRLAVLTHMIGAHPDFNCKSGKDRTGALDIEAKNLAWQIESTGDVPLPDTERDDEQRGNFHRLAMEGGNIELQKLNTGVPGYKLKATKRLARFLGYLEGGRELMSAITLDRASDGGRDSGGESIRTFQGLASFEGS